MKIYQKLFQILEPGQKRAAILLLLLMIIGMMFETLGIGLVIPAISGLENPDILRNAFKWVASESFVAELTDNALIMIALGLVFFIYVLKTAFLTFLAWWQSQFIFGLQAAFSRKLFTGYMKLPYSFHLQRNSANLIRNSLNEVTQLTLVILSTASLTAECLVIIGIIGLLLVYEPIGTFIVFLTLTIPVGLMYWFMRHRLLNWGVKRQFHEGAQLKHLQQGFGGIKDAKLLGREDYFIETFAIDNVEAVKYTKYKNFFSLIPRYVLELVMVMGIAVLTAVLILQNKPIDAIIPTLALFAVTAFRLIPSLNRILSSINHVRYGHPVIETLNNELELMADLKHRKRHRDKMNFEHQLTLENLSYSYEEVDKPAIKDINLSIKKGSSVGFIGESGAGKSTLIDVILGLLTPTEGTIRIDDQKIEGNVQSWQNLIGYVPQAIYLTDDTLRSNIAFGVETSEIDKQQIAIAVKAAHLTEFFASLPEGLDTVVGEAGVRLSGGQRQRIGIARALYHNPSVLVLDEATSALDNESEQEVMSAVNDLKSEKTILIIAHRLSTIEDCDYLYCLDNGKIVKEGRPEEVLS